MDLKTICRAQARKTKDELDSIDLVKKDSRMVVTASVNSLKIVRIKRVKGLHSNNINCRAQLAQHIKMDRSN